MIRTAVLLTIAALASSVPTAQTTGGQAKAAPLVTRPERTNFEETSRLEDVSVFLTALAAESPVVRVQTFGTIEEGRPMPLVTLSNPAVSRPAERPAGRPVVFLLANIHGGEVEGKEAVQVLMRRLTSGDLRPLLDRMVIVIAPIYNVDGNEAVDVMNRTAQYGPVAGVGRRENAKGLDLNRDYMKLESTEARALAAAFTAWDPHLMVDLHTTNGCKCRLRYKRSATCASTKNVSRWGARATRSAWTPRAAGARPVRIIWTAPTNSYRTVISATCSCPTKAGAS